MAFFPRHLAATAVLAALALPALAQPAPPAPAAAPSTQSQPGHPMHHGHGHGHGDAERHQRQAPDRAQMQERMAQHQAALKQSLQLTAEQEPAWNTFIGTMHPEERTARLGRLSPQELQQLTTPERIDRMRALRAQRSAEADRMGEAVKQFYAQLTPAQQKTFDAQTWRHHRGMGSMGERQGRREGKHHGQHHRKMHRDQAPARAPAAVPAAAPAQ